MLQQGDNLRVHEMRFPLTPPGVFGAAIQVAVGVDLLGIGGVVTHQALGGDLFQSGAADAAGAAVAPGVADSVVAEFFRNSRR